MPAIQILWRDPDGPPGGETLLDLFARHEIVEADLDEAIDLILADPAVERIAIGGAYRLDIRAAVAGSVLARAVLSRPDASRDSRRQALLIALLLHRPERLRPGEGAPPASRTRVVLDWGRD
ncbi:hypothetical protein M446_1382 [Methylobacterium sp. 4-46]|nr:hypothetical protein M446_1382 [Methylobacterium sp. 4-46]